MACAATAWLSLLPPEVSCSRLSSSARRPCCPPGVPSNTRRLRSTESARPAFSGFTATMQRSDFPTPIGPCSLCRSARAYRRHFRSETRGSLRFPVYPCTLATFPNSAEVAGAVLVAPRPFRLRRLGTARPSEVVISKPTRAARVLACLRIALALPLPAQGWLPAGWTALAGRDSHPLDTQQFSEVRLRNLLVPYWDVLITP